MDFDDDGGEAHSGGVGATIRIARVERGWIVATHRPPRPQVQAQDKAAKLAALMKLGAQAQQAAQRQTDEPWAGGEGELERLAQEMITAGEEQPAEPEDCCATYVFERAEDLLAHVQGFLAVPA